MPPTMAHPNLCPLPCTPCNCFHHCLHTLIIVPACNNHWHVRASQSRAPCPEPSLDVRLPGGTLFLGTRQAGPGSTVYRALWAPAHSHPPPLLPRSAPGPGAAGTFLSRGADSPGPSWGAFVPLLTSIPCGRSHRPLGPRAELWALASVRREQPEKAAPRLCLRPRPRPPSCPAPRGFTLAPQPRPSRSPSPVCSQDSASSPTLSLQQCSGPSPDWRPVFPLVLFHLFCSKLKQGTGLSVESPGYHILGTSQIDPRVSPRSESLLWTFLPLRHRLAQTPSPRP